MTLSEDIVKKIEQEKIAPKPKWVFLLNDFVYWGVFAVSLIFGGVLSGLIFYLYKMQDLEAMSKAKGFLNILLKHAPYYWLLAVGLFIFVAFYNFYHTPKGYRFSPIKVVVVNLIFSLLLGFAISEVGLGKLFDTWLQNKVPQYTSCEMRRISTWSHPDHGLLAGEIKDIKKEALLLQDFSGKTWNINISQASWQEESLKKVGERIKLTGSMFDANNFIAQEIKTWQCGCQKETDCSNGQCGRKCSF